MTTELVGIYTKKVEGDTSKQWTISGFFVHRFWIERKIRFFVGEEIPQPPVVILGPDPRTYLAARHDRRNGSLLPQG